MYVFVTTREKQATVKAVLSLNVLFVNVVSLAGFISVVRLPRCFFRVACCLMLLCWLAAVRLTGCC